MGIYLEYAWRRLLPGFDWILLCSPRSLYHPGSSEGYSSRLSYSMLMGDFFSIKKSSARKRWGLLGINLGRNPFVRPCSLGCNCTCGDEGLTANISAEQVYMFYFSIGTI